MDDSTVSLLSLFFSIGVVYRLGMEVLLQDQGRFLSQIAETKNTILLQDQTRRSNLLETDKTIADTRSYRHMHIYLCVF
jgi:hypothetical protein